MKRFRLTRRTHVAQPIERVFGFFSDAGNLQALTPPWLGFEILTPEPIRMTVGARIDYRIRLRGLPLRWRSEITAWEPPHRFVDVQLRGPYRSWVHEHRFVARDGGTEVLDEVEYSVLGGSWVQRLLVAPDLERVFDYRAQRLHELLDPDSGSRPAPAAPAPLVGAAS